MKTVVITGCAGFLGSNLAKKLILKGNKVIGIDNFCTGQKRNIDNLYALTNNDQSKFNFIKLDLNDKCASDYYYIFGEENIDKIYHFASPASPPKYKKLSIQTMQVNTFATEALLEYCSLKKIKFIFASTSEVYGDPLEHPQKETYYGNVNPFGARSLYDNSKRMGETFCYEYKRLFNTEVRIVRLFNSYGPNQEVDDGRVVTNFITQILKSQPLTIYGDGTQTRSLCYVDDTISGIIKIAESDHSGPVNLGTTQELSILQIREKVIDAFISLDYNIDQDYPTVHLPLTQDDPKQRKPDISLVQELTDWAPQYSLEEGLIETIKYFKEVV